jgi:flagellar basal-body rod modification protein FlgD
MTVNGINGTTGTNTATATTSTKSAKDNMSLDQDAFLKILVAELKNQSPDKPADTTQMMTQEAQFSQLNAMQNMQKSTEAMLTSVQSGTATGMLGKSIVATNASGGDDITGVVTGVKLGTDGPVLKIGNTEVSLSLVREVGTSS